MSTFEQKFGEELLKDRSRKAAEAQAERAARIKLIRFSEIVLTTDPDYLVKGLIPRVGMTIVWGPQKSGKSFWLFDLMMHVALDWLYRGRRVQHGPVVYCYFEGQQAIPKRKEAFQQQFLSEDADPPFYLQPLRLDLIAEHEALIDAIRQQLGDAAPAAVTLDTLNRSLSGSESSDEDMSNYKRTPDVVEHAGGT
jgi:RecA-family ATPase